MRRHQRFAANEVAVGIAVLAAATVLMVLNFTGALSSILSGSGDDRTVTAVLSDAKQLHAGDPVRIDGISVGTVKDISSSGAGGLVRVSMALEDSAGPLYVDARAALRWRTLLGGAFYIRLERGTPGAGPLGDRPIPVTRTVGQVELEDVLSFNRGDARAGLRKLPGELAEALSDPQAPTQALDRLATVAPTARSALRAIRGRQVGRDLPALIANSAAAVRALDTPARDVRGLVQGAATTLETVAARRADLRSTFAQAPAVLRRTDATLGRLDNTLEGADPLLRDLRAPSARVAATLASVRPTLVDADRLLLQTAPLVRSLRPAVASLAQAARQGRPLLNGLEPSIDRLDKIVLPYFAEKDPGTQHSLAEMIGPALGHLGGGATGQMDQNGHFIRFPASSGSSPIYLPCQIYINNPDATKLATCRSLQESLDTLLTYNPIGQTPGTTPPPSRAERTADR